MFQVLVRVLVLGGQVLVLVLVGQVLVRISWSLLSSPCPYILVLVV